MEETYWKQFARTGRVEDYLHYKGMEICRDIMERYEDKSSESVDNGDGNDPVGITHRRI